MWCTCACEMELHASSHHRANVISAFKRSMSLRRLARSCDDLRLRAEGLWAKTPPQTAESQPSKKQEVWRQRSDKEGVTHISALHAREQSAFNQPMALGSLLAHIWQAWMIHFPWAQVSPRGLNGNPTS